MRVIKQIILFGVVGLLMMSCATSGPKYSEMADSTQPLGGKLHSRRRQKRPGLYLTHVHLGRRHSARG